MKNEMFYAHETECKTFEQFKKAILELTSLYQLIVSVLTLRFTIS